MSASALGQGTVRFNNSANNLVWITADPTGSTLEPLGQGYVQLYYAPAGTDYRDFYLPTPLTPSAWFAANPGWTLGPITTMSSVPGLYDGGITEVSGIADGAAMDYTVIGWQTGATTFDEAYQAGLKIGVSTKDQIIIGGSPPAELAAGNTHLVLDFTPIPEPSSVALVILGAIAFLLAYRHRQLQARFRFGDNQSKALNHGASS